MSRKWLLGGADDEAGRSGVVVSKSSSGKVWVCPFLDIFVRSSRIYNWVRILENLSVTLLNEASFRHVLISHVLCLVSFRVTWLYRPSLMKTRLFCILQVFIVACFGEAFWSNVRMIFSSAQSKRRFLFFSERAFLVFHIRKSWNEKEKKKRKKGKMKRKTYFVLGRFSKVRSSNRCGGSLHVSFFLLREWCCKECFYMLWIS